jgi:hypothetical protein
MTDYLWNFPVTGLPLALDGLAALRGKLGLSESAVPLNALGDPRDTTGAIITPVARIPGKTSGVPVAWIGRPGSAATSFADPTGKTVNMAAKGNPDRYYMNIRSDKTATGFDPAAYGFVTTPPAESAAVLGVWAGDHAP